MQTHKKLIRDGNIKMDTDGVRVERVKLALAMIVKPGEADYLKRALDYTAKYVDGVFITITGEDKEMEAICKKHSAFVSHFTWVHDFSKARNFNFKQVPKEYTHIFWMDSDDLFRDVNNGGSDLSNLKDYIEKNLDTDIFLMNYIYWWDEWKNPIIIHLKEQIIKNDDCVEWVGALHETFRAKRVLNVKLLKDIERLHISDEKRAHGARERNYEIALKEFKERPEDPRCLWNLANSQKACDLKEDALKVFDDFLKASESEDERYIAMLRMAEIYISQKEYHKALDIIKYAIGTKPDYPDAYHVAGNLYFELQDFHKARDSYLMGLKKKPPKYDIVIYNPRDYDYYPLKNLAKTYLELMMPTQAYGLLQACLKICPNDEQLKLIMEAVRREKNHFNNVLKKVAVLNKIKDKKKLEKALNDLPDNMQAHPAVLMIRNKNFVKKTSSGKDLTYFCAQTPEQWNPESVKTKGIGGSEEAVINLTKKWKEAGWNVTVYASVGRDVKVFDGVTYKPWWMFNAADRTDVLVLWRLPMMLDHELNAAKIFVDSHDVIEEGEFNQKRLAKIDKIFVKSKAHRDLYPNIPDEKFIILPNAVDFTLFDKHKNTKRDPYFLVNFSSPDRSLNALLDIYAEVLKRVSPDIKKKVKMAWYYGWDLFEKLRTRPNDIEWRQKVQAKFAELGNKMEGGVRINHEQVAIMNLMAGALVYPSQFYEIDWVGGSKAQLAGCVPITSNYAAIGEKVKFGVKIDVSKLPVKSGLDLSISDPTTKEMFVNAIVDYLEDPEKWDKERIKMMEWARKEFDLDRISGEWIKEFQATKLIIKK